MLAAHVAPDGTIANAPPSEVRAKALPLRPGPEVVGRKTKRYTLADLPESAPKHCHHCHSLGARDWWIYVWAPNAACSPITRIPYQCGSWRCPSCRVHESHVCWTRMMDAFRPFAADSLIFMVLTLDRLGTYSGVRRWENLTEAYRELGKMSADFFQRLRRWQKRMGWKPLKNEWVATVEMHASGWPHVNIVMAHAELATWIREQTKAGLDDHLTSEQARLVCRELADCVVGAGFGVISTAEAARSKSESLSYICKVAGKQDETMGELAKLTQLPTAAPPRFRRLRAGKGFLPPRKSSEMTGTLVRRQHSNDGTRDVIPLHNVSAPLVAQAENACATEEKIWLDELEAAHRCARQVKRFGMSAVELPAVTHWFRKKRLEGLSRKAMNDNVFGPERILSQCQLE